MTITTQTLEHALQGAEDIKQVAVEALTALYKLQMIIEEGQKGSYPSEVVYPTAMSTIRKALANIDTTVSSDQRHQDNTKPVPKTAPDNIDRIDTLDRNYIGSNPLS